MRDLAILGGLFAGSLQSPQFLLMLALGAACAFLPRSAAVIALVASGCSVWRITAWRASRESLGLAPVSPFDGHIVVVTIAGVVLAWALAVLARRLHAGRWPKVI